MHARHRGFTIIEFMIAITLSLLVLAALTAAFVANSRSRAEIEKANEQIESGRFALQILTDDIEVAGFYSQFNIDIALTAADGPLPVPTALPQPCLTALSVAGVNNDLNDAFPMHIQGYDSGTFADDTAATAAGLTCITGEDVNYDADIMIVRRTATCAVGDANCGGVVGAPYFQASLCSSGNELNTTVASNYYKIAAATSAAVPVATALNLHSRDCTTAAPARQLLTHIYFVANNDQPGDGVPTLKRAELGNASDPDGFTVVPLAHGIQDLQIQYGVDSDGDGAPNEFKDEPANVTEWRNVMAVRLHLLSRNSTPTRDHVDTKVYTLAGADQGPFNDGFKRHVYQTSVRLMNPAGRREQ